MQFPDTMKKITILFSLFSFTVIWAQPNTEVYLLDMVLENGKVNLINPRNVSNNEGYDNQPSFYSDEFLSFSSTRNGQTDIAQYHIGKKTISWITDTPNGSEYSPLKIPKKAKISSIRLDTDGLQRLYSYDRASGKAIELLKDLKVGYHLWYSADILVFTVLVENRMDLMVADISMGTQKTVAKNVGRSLHKIPNSHLVSFIHKEGNASMITSLDPSSGIQKKITPLFEGVEDICWLANGTILMPKGNTIWTFDPRKDAKWSILRKFSEKNLYSISRIAVSNKGNFLSLVAEESPEIIVQKQLDAYNAKDVKAFLATYAEDVKIYNFPNTLLYEGKTTVKEQYSRMFGTITDLNCELKKRMVIGNRVIDEEYLTMNGSHFNAVAIYEVENGKITSVTFIQ